MTTAIDTTKLNINFHVFEIIDCDIACQGGSSFYEKSSTKGLNYQLFRQQAQTYLDTISEGLSITGNKAHVFSNENLQRLVQYDFEGQGDGPPFV